VEVYIYIFGSLLFENGSELSHIFIFNVGASPRGWVRDLFQKVEEEKRPSGFFECTSPNERQISVSPANPVLIREGFPTHIHFTKPISPPDNPQPMAHIYGISGSTRYLLNGTRPVNGKKPANLEEIEHFLSHYDEILDETEKILHRKQNEMILKLIENEVRLDLKIQGDIARRTQEVNTRILEINAKIETSESFLWRSGYMVQFWWEKFLRSYRINGPSHNDRVTLHSLRQQKKRAVDNKPAVVKAGCRIIYENKKFLNANESFLIGAKGEEEVINVLSALPDSYHILNDVNLRFQDYIYWKKYREYIRTCQIDHIVIGPTGLWLLETKNWTRSSFKDKSYDLVHQVNRANYALWYYLKDNYWKNEMPSIRKVVVSMHGYSRGQRADPYISILSPERLCDYITRPNPHLSESDIHKLIRIIPCRVVC